MCYLAIWHQRTCFWLGSSADTKEGCARQRLKAVFTNWPQCSYAADGSWISSNVTLLCSNDLTLAVLHSFDFVLGLCITPTLGWSFLDTAFHLADLFMLSPLRRNSLKFLAVVLGLSRFMTSSSLRASSFCPSCSAWRSLYCSAMPISDLIFV